MRVLALVAALVGCGGDPEPSLPDAAPHEPYGYCERLQDARPCLDECRPGWQAVCGYERACGTWDDCDGCYQCRALFWCECR